MKKCKCEIGYLGTYYFKLISRVKGVYNRVKGVYNFDEEKYVSRYYKNKKDAKRAANRIAKKLGWEIIELADYFRTHNKNNEIY